MTYSFRLGTLAFARAATHEVGVIDFLGRNVNADVVIYCVIIIIIIDTKASTPACLRGLGLRQELYTKESI
jgi:hypothetical protein